MPCREVVLDCEWFVLGRHRLIKQLSFCDVRTHMSHLYKFSIPRCYSVHAAEFRKHAAHSHVLLWSAPGEYCRSMVDHVIKDIVCRLDEEEANVCFWTKGVEKAAILKTYGPDV